MKKFVTTLGIVTIICIVIGTCIHVGGFFMNGVKLFGKPIFSLGSGTDTVSFSEDYSGVEKLDLNMSVGDVFIEEGSTFNVSFEGREDLKPEVSLKDNKLVIKQKKDFNVTPVNLGKLKSRITVTVPSDVTIERLDAELDMGNLEIKDVSCKDLFADLSMGNLEIRNAKAEKIGADNDMGDCRIYNSEFNELTADCDMGNIHLELVDSPDNYGIHATCDMGDVKIDGDKEGNNYSTKGDKTITLNVAMGNITVE